MTSPDARRILSSVRSFAREHDLLRPGPLVVAVSGGSDSVALLAVLAALAPRAGCVLHVAYFDHRIRPRAGARDAAFVADLAARFGAPVRVGRAEKAPASEDAARRARYDFLRRAARELGATAIATGHTKDDQAETVLLHAVRGAGLAGIAAMRPSRDGIVRPLLVLRRADTAAICAAYGIAPREDPTNRSLRYARNRVRHRVLPELARINPRATDALARLAGAAATARDALDARVEASLASASDGDRIFLDRLGDDPELRGECLARAWQRVTGRVLSARGRAALAREVARRDGSASVDLPGGRALREYATLRLAAARGPGSERAATIAEGLAPAGAAVRLEPDRPAEWRGWRFLLTRDGPDGRYSLRAGLPDGHEVGIAVRSRRSGDRMAGGMRIKVQDVMTDEKVPARDRSGRPLVVLGDGSVWWVPGVTDPPRTEDGWTVAARPPEEVNRNERWVARVPPLASVVEGRKEGIRS